MMSCRHTRSQVRDSRDEGHEDIATSEFRFIKRRRRQCIDCNARFTTYEVTEEMFDNAALHALSNNKRAKENVRYFIEGVEALMLKFLRGGGI